jgi:hypothetical protein
MMTMQPQRAGTGGLRANMRTPVVAWLVVMALLAGGLPAITGIVVIADPTPTFSLDICHPIGAVSYSLGQSAAPLVPARLTPPVPGAFDFIADFVVLFSPLANRAPDPPPPKTAV